MHINYGRYTQQPGEHSNKLSDNLEYKRAISTLKQLADLNTIEVQQVISDLTGAIVETAENNEVKAPALEPYIAQCIGSSISPAYPRLRSSLLNITVNKHSTVV